MEVKVKKKFLVQVIRTDQCFVDVEAGDMGEALELAQDMFSIDQSDMMWEPVDGYQYYAIQGSGWN